MIKLSYKSIALVLMMIFISFNGFSQLGDDRATSNFWDDVRFGGGIGLGFGNGFFSGTLAPSAIYQFDNLWAAGLGLNFTYASQRDRVRSTILGASVIGLFDPFPSVQLSAEFEELNVNRNFDEQFVINEDQNYWYSALYLGAGYRTGNVTFGIRYDVLYDEETSIFADPWMPFVRVYF